jgi:dTDP-L-rhamnose 4-epimerase
MCRNVLITGGSGFIGSNLSLRLLREGYNVRILDNLSEQIHGNGSDSYLYQSIKGLTDFRLGDVRNRADLKNSIDGIEVIVHLAAETGTGQSMYEIKKYVETNSLGTANLLDVLVNEKHNVQKVIVASSRAIYGEGKYYCENHGDVYPQSRTNMDLQHCIFEPKCKNCGSILTALATDENSLVNPSSVYGITKFNQEQLVLNVCKSISIPSIAFRYQNVFGPGQSLINPYTGILSIFSNLILTDKEINIFEDGKESRDFVFIDDVIEATLLGIQKKGEINDSFNVGTGNPINVESVTQYLMKIYDKKVDTRISGDYRIGDIRHNFADLNKIKGILNFNPKYDFIKGLELFCTWVKSQEITKCNYEESLKEMMNKKLFIEK